MIDARYTSQCCAALGVAAALLTRAASAQGPEIVYHAPLGCPNAEQFMARVGQTLGGSLEPFSAFGRFRVTIARAAEGYRVSVASEVRGAQGARTISAPDCGSAADAAALSIVMALDSAMTKPERLEPPVPAAVESSRGPSGTAGSTLELSEGQSLRSATPAQRSPQSSARLAPAAPAAAVPGQEALDSQPVNASPASGSTRSSIAMHLVADSGSLPSPAPGLRLALGLGRTGERWSANVGLLALRPTAQWVDGQEGRVGGSFWLGAGRAEGCLSVSGTAESSLDGCLVVEAGALVGSGLGVDVAKQGAVVWLAPGARVVGSVPLTPDRTRLRLGLEGLLPLGSERFTVERGQTELYGPRRLVGRLDLGAEWRFH